MTLDSRVTVLEEDSAELEIRIETVEGTATDHETRLTASENEIEDRLCVCNNTNFSFFSFSFIFVSTLETRLTASKEKIHK